jgi:hypothetical protein
MTEQETKTCLACDKDARIRGLCVACYSAARRAVRIGRVTEEELVAGGLMLASDRTGRPTGRPPSSAFQRALKKLQDAP